MQKSLKIYRFNLNCDVKHHIYALSYYLHIWVERIKTLYLSFEMYDIILKRKLNLQIDPFGHSSAHAALSAQMGLKGLFFARMHYQDYDKRKKEKKWVQNLFTKQNCNIAQS